MMQRFASFVKFTMLGRVATTSARFARPAMAVAQKRNLSVPNMMMNTVWRKSTGMYITYIVAGCIVLEGIYGGVTTTIWNTMNHGVSL